MIIQRRTKPHVSTANREHRKVADNKDPAPAKKIIHHWAFLDEIEAPMWADLNLEATSCYKDNDDDWFHVSHQFHQLSSRKLVSALSHACEAKVQVNLGIKGSSSPNLPPSVSKSRGKDYKGKDLMRGFFGIKASKEHPIRSLNGKSSWTNSGLGQKLKPHPSDDNRKETSTSKSNSVCESTLTEITRLSSSNLNSNTEVSKATISSSTITYENNERQELKFGKKSTFGLTSGLLSELKVTQRKSCVTRQALRVENVGGRQSRGSKSSSGKSSVGSSSHPNCDDGNATGVSRLKSKDATPESRNVNTKPFEVDKMIGLAKSKKSRVGSLATSCESKMSPTKSIHEGTAKPKVAQVVNSKVLRPRRENKPLAAVTNANCKTEGKRYNNRLGNGKENARIRTSAGDGDLVGVQKVKKPNVVQKIIKPDLIGPKVKKICSQDEKNIRTSVTKKFHFR